MGQVADKHSGYQVGGTSRARVFPKHRGDLLEASVVASEMRRGEVEPVDVANDANINTPPNQED